MLHRLPPELEADQYSQQHNQLEDHADGRVGSESATRTVFRSCSLCEAACGLVFEVAGQPGAERIVSVRPDHDDVHSKGYICPKGIAMAAVHHDPDRLRTPMRRRADGEFEPITWDEAFDLVGERLLAIRREHGNDSIASYFGNPVTHNHGALLMRNGFQKALGSRNSFSAGSQDTSPRFAASHYLYGSSLVIPVPDVDRSDYFLCIGANPLISQGSAMAGADVKNRIRAIRERGGKVVVVDPRRSETAKEADELVQIRPGGDASFLLAFVKLVVDRSGVPAAVRAMLDGWDAVAARLERLDVSAAARHAGVEVAVLERLAQEFTQALRPVAYTRIGVCNNRFGTLATFAGDLLDIVAGRLGAAGGAMFTTPALDAALLAHVGKMDGHARWHSRIRKLPETVGDLPAACLAEEIEAPGDGQIRALITYAGNPALSLPNGRRVTAALEKLDFMVSIDIYLNETTRHADVILPPAWSLAEDHIDAVVPMISIRNIARWSPPVVSKQPGELADWEILHELALRLGGGPFGLKALDSLYRIGRHAGWKWTPDSSVDLVLRMGPRGDRFNPWSSGLSLKKLRAATHGLDLGALEEGVAHRIFHKDGKIHVGAAPFLAAMDELIEKLQTPHQQDELLLVGRRELRTNNSWMHNVPSLVSGRGRCVLFVHPDDARSAGIEDNSDVLLTSRVHSGPVRIKITDEMRPGVVSLPHGYGHAASARWQRVAGAHAGVSVNDWTDDSEVEGIVGQSILNGVSVRLSPLPQEAAA
ncbi:MAG TPA: molybdopterin-dependent oxidoreductase [Candidatus Limnocylindrales bacterium]|nr:molybdopterin-dependent oxidoreductase [Candidatus Limnocylindrales bacterium]